MTTSRTVIIIGGAVIGSATAYFLAQECAPGTRIVVLEQDPSYQRAATTRSLASIRQQFSTPINIQISQFGFEFLSSLRSSVGGDSEVSLREGGYLMLATADGLDALTRNASVQRDCRANVAMFNAEQLRQRMPWLNVDDLAAGALGLGGEGWCDPHLLLQWLKRRARELGVTYRTAKVTRLVLQGARITGVEIAGGETLGCDVAVNAAGTGAVGLMAEAGLPLPVEARKRNIFVFDCRRKQGITRCPLVVDPTGVYFRPEGEYFLAGAPTPADRDLPSDDWEVDHGLFDELVWPVLAHRVPVFEAVRVVNAWAGHYDYNTFDQNALIGPMAEVENLYVANGFSGHGLQQAPAVGRALAEHISHGHYRSLDLSPLSPARIAAGNRLVEHTVI